MVSLFERYLAQANEPRRNLEAPVKLIIISMVFQYPPVYPAHPAECTTFPSRTVT